MKIRLSCIQIIVVCSLLKMSLPTDDVVVIPDYVHNLIKEIAEKHNFTEYTVIPKDRSTVGDGLIAIMVRATIKGKRKCGNSLIDDELALLCKLQPTAAFRKQISIIPFQKEVFVYKELLPTLCKFQREKGLSSSDGFFAFPKCYGTYVNEANKEYAIVMEDLRCHGYRMWNKLHQLDFHHAKMMMIELGKYHAISFALRDQRPDLFARFNKIECEGFKRMGKDSPMRGMFERAFDKALNTLSAKESKIRKKLEALRSTFPEELSASTQVDSAEPFGVINHGDCWNNNIMYQYEEGGTNMTVAKGICLVDWQMMQFCSPATDLMYYLFMSTERQLRAEHFDDLLWLYYNSLAKALQQLGSDPDKLFTYSDLQDQMKTFGIYPLILALFLIQVLTVKPSELPDLDSLAIDDKTEFIRDEETERKYRIRMRDVLLDITSRGYY